MKVKARAKWLEILSKYWLAVFIVIMVFIFIYGFDWTGFNGYNKITIAHIISGANAGTVTRTEEYQPAKTLWDWLQLLGVLAIPVVGGFVGAWYTAQQGKVSERETTDNQRETLLQAYIDNMSALLLHEKLRVSGEDDEVRKIARVRTLTVLSRLDGKRKGTVLQFLSDVHLINKEKRIIDVRGANLRLADLSGANLPEVNLSGANLSGANLSDGVASRRANFSNGVTHLGANLSGANLSGANLNEVNFSGADLSEANLSNASLQQANFLMANFSRANFSGANFAGSDLSGASLSGANFKGALFYSEEQVKEAIARDEMLHRH